MVLVGIGIMVIAVLGIYTINSSIEAQQELSNTNVDMILQHLEISEESTSVTAETTDDSDYVIIKNDSKQDITIIQYRIYDDDGSLLATISADDMIGSYTESESSLSIEYLKGYVDGSAD
jgi:uncharacterized protein YcfL